MIYRFYKKLSEEFGKFRSDLWKLKFSSAWRHFEVMVLSAEFAHAWLSLKLVILLSPAFFGPKSQSLLCTVRGRKLWLKHCFEDGVMLVMVDAMVLIWYFCLFFGKYQNDLAFSAIFHFLSKLGTMSYSDSNHLRVISSVVGGIW